ncbi:MAG: PEP-CTERM sorting domain-containing protein [Pirellulales bacterium]
MRHSLSVVLAFVLSILSLETGFAQTVIGPPVHFRATDIVVPAPSSDVLHLSMDVYLEVPNGPIDVTAFGMLFNVAPDGAPVTLTAATNPSAARPPIFPPGESILEFVSPAASGHDGAAIGLYLVPNANVSIEPGEYGLFTLHLDVAPNTVGTYDLVFDTNPEFSGLAGNLENNGVIIYPNAEGNLVKLASITIVPEPSSWALAAAAAATGLGWRLRRRRAAQPGAR